MANAFRDLVRAPRTLMLASTLAASLGGCSTMGEREMVAAAPAPGGALTQAGTDAPTARRSDPDGQCLACFPGLLQMPLFGLR